jgi:hypothetical protein
LTTADQFPQIIVNGKNINGQMKNGRDIVKRANTDLQSLMQAPDFSYRKNHPLSEGSSLQSRSAHPIPDG